MDNTENIWPKKITVDKSIIKILSGSTYANFPSAIREIIVNSYDADATFVTVNVDIENEIIEINDDGRGMDEHEFSLYIRIAGKSRKRESKMTMSKRRVIGQFGIGFLSILPFCEKYEIRSKKRGSDSFVQAIIPSKDYFRDDGKELEEIPIYGSVGHDTSLKSQQFTKIRLMGFSPLAKAFFEGKYKIAKKRATVRNNSPLELLRWELNEFLPLKYKAHKDLDSIFEDDSTIPFNVELNSEKLYRNIYAEHIIDISEDYVSIGKIKFKYAILANYDPIHPIEGRYLMIRNLNIGVGARTTFDLGMDGKVFAKLSHLTGEVNIVEGMNELISVSRDKFNFSPDYENLKEFLREKLKEKAYEFDDVQSFENLKKQVVGTKKLNNLASLDTQELTKKIETFEKRGYTIKKTHSNADDSNQEIERDIKIDRLKKEVYIPDNFADIYKQIRVSGKVYRLKLSEWRVNEFQPAVRIENDFILVNKLYPLFKSEDKSIEIFIKIHIILLETFMQNKMDKTLYIELIREIENNF